MRRLLGLVPLPNEGGEFVESYRARVTIPPGALGPDRPDARSLATAIYYLLRSGSFSAIHRVRSDEVFHFYLGDPVEMLQLAPDGTGRVLTLGTELMSGMRPQALVPAGVWQGTRLCEDVGPDGFALLGTTVSPGFDFADFELGARDRLVAEYPAYAGQIRSLTRAS